MAQLVEHNLAKVGVAGSSPVVRSIWAFSSGGERFPDTEEVRSSNLLTPTKCSQLRGYLLWAVFVSVQLMSKQLSKFGGIHRTIWNVKLCMDLSIGTLRCRYNATNIP